MRNESRRSLKSVIKELAYLYDRRSTLDTAIQSLEEYERFRRKNERLRPLKPA
jgi:hypothetical protein